MDQKTLSLVLSQFCLEESITPYGNGHINDTYRVSTNTQPYILQRINTAIFQNPQQLMENITRVTEFLKKKIVISGGDPERETLTVIPTKSGNSYYQLDDNNAFRVYKFIGNTITIDSDKTPTLLYEAGVGFGHFQKMLSDFPALQLHETIKDFHHTPKRIQALKDAVQSNLAGRADSVQDEIAFALENASWADTVVRGIADGSIPLRVTHNDTKINNILFDQNTQKAICVIDLDTVMPGSMLYDFGDALRMGASSAAEDEPNLDLVHFEEELFAAFTKGYLSETKDSLTPREIELLPLSVKLMTYECGIRFLTDYLNGDTYFKIHREKQNLDRARNQFKLVQEISDKEPILQKIVSQALEQC